ncbi:hypothetical protein Syun_000267 [Stephania yunnanensis]|uniref:Uncharacterized protein n=1 Tax=Stephania yunnanensis TaxID=152371 RepID=A0AAP0Q556_9MAGN
MRHVSEGGVGVGVQVQACSRASSAAEEWRVATADLGRPTCILETRRVERRPQKSWESSEKPWPRMTRGRRRGGRGRGRARRRGGRVSGRGGRGRGLQRVRRGEAERVRGRERDAERQRK